MMNRTWVIKKFLFFLVVLPGLTTAAQKNKYPDKRFDGLDTAFARIIREWNCPGFAVAVVDHQRVLYAKGFGYADLANKIPVTEHTQFAAGSCIKPFTCALLGILRQEGKVDFDQPAVQFLPGLKFYNQGLDEQITVRDMMTHRTGIPRHDLAWALFTTRSPDTLLRRIQFLEPAFRIREKWHYNNFMYLAQGMMIEHLSGRTYEAFLREKILNPLGMKDLNFSVDTMVRQKDFSYGYVNDASGKAQLTPYVNLDVMKPVGGMNTSVSEMAKWVMLWLNKGKHKGQQLIPEAYVQDAKSSQMIVGGGLPTLKVPDVQFETYGLGWFQSSYRGHYRVEHGGNISGFSTSTCFFPSDSLGIVIFCNQDVSNNKVIAAVKNLIADRLLQLPYKDWQSLLYGPTRIAKTGQPGENVQQPAKDTKANQLLPAGTANDFEGDYTNPGYGSFTVTAEGDSLFAHISGQSFFLRHSRHTVFDLLSKSDNNGYGGAWFSVVFNCNAGGNIESAGILLEPTIDKPILFTRKVKGIILPPAQLAKFTGEFQLGNMQVRLQLKDNKDLYLIIPGQPDYLLEALTGGKFMLKGQPDITISFTETGVITPDEFILNQQGTLVKAVRKK